MIDQVAYFFDIHKRMHDVLHGKSIKYILGFMLQKMIHPVSNQLNLGGLRTLNCHIVMLPKH